MGSPCGADSGFTIQIGVLAEYTSSGKNVVSPDGVTTIGENAFYNRTSMTGVAILNSVTKIGTAAFSRCKNQRSIIPESVTPI